MSLLDYGFTAPQQEPRNVHKPYTFSPPYIILRQYAMPRLPNRLFEIDFVRHSETRAGSGYWAHSNKCPCGANDWHGGGGPLDHSPMPLIPEYEPGAVRYGVQIVLDMTRMAKGVLYRFSPVWRRGRLAGVKLNVYKFGGGTEFSRTDYLERTMRPGDTA